jgi:DNA-binding LacI/PurR family transcriptional regulator
MTPASREICDYLLNGILRGEFSVNGELPTEVALARTFKVSRMSAHFAVKTLEQHGVVRRRKRSGTVVARHPSAPLARRIRAVVTRRVHVVSSFETPVRLHWDESTLREIESFLGEQGYAVTHLGPPSPLTRENLREQLKSLSEEGSAALVLMPTALESAFLIANTDLIFQYHRNVYLFDRGDTPVEKWPFNVVSLDPFGEGVLAGEFLESQGYRHVAFWETESSTRYWSAERFRGLGMGVQRASEAQRSPEHWLHPGDGGAAEVCRRLRQAAGHCAVVAVNDQAAAMLLDHARASGLEAPRDFGLIGFDDDPRVRAHNITTVAPPTERIGRELARLVCRKAGEPDAPAVCIVKAPSRLVVRGTCRPQAPEASGA